jgi:hypothetical protein
VEESHALASPGSVNDMTAVVTRTTHPLNHQDQRASAKKLDTTELHSLSQQRLSPVIFSTRSIQGAIKPRPASKHEKDGYRELVMLVKQIVNVDSTSGKMAGRCLGSLLMAVA